MSAKTSQERRSWNMQQIRSKNTRPELLVRSALYRDGIRFRLHSKILPGKPDIVIAKFKTVIFVHGCFWHRHRKCIDASRPKTNSEYWEAKLMRNVERDKEQQIKLRKLGWKVAVLWECEVNENKSNLYQFLIKKRIS